MISPDLLRQPRVMVLVLSALMILLVSCGGQSATTSGAAEETKPRTEATENRSESEEPEAASRPLAYASHNKNAGDTEKVEEPETAIVIDTADSRKRVRSDLAGLIEQKNGIAAGTEDNERLDELEIYGAALDNEDSASAVDDAVWRMLDLADEYHRMGVLANREASWEEAQYYFEKAVKILARLDIDSETIETPEAKKYTIILENIISDYRVTLRSLGELEGDETPSVVVERFGDLETKLGYDSLRVFKEEVKQVTYDLPVKMNDRVKNSVVYFQTVAKEAFTKYLSRSDKYRALFLKKLREHGLPEDLIYLSLVESGYNPRAYSWARASGLWQFISSTGRMYGLNRSWWIDERRDPEKATDAACRFLKDLYKQFGDWELAMAAYNGGPGRVRGTIKKQKTTDFWKMRLRRQTMDYIPLIYAAAIIAKNPERYGFNDVGRLPAITWDEVTIDRCLELKVVAREIGCTVDELKELNPELLRNFTPPNVKRYKLKVPTGKESKFLAAYPSMPSPKETSWVKHKIRRGETVSTIASRYGVSQYAILESNNLSRRARIYAGKTLIVPVPLDREYSRSRSKKKQTYTADGSVYTVRSGDTMWDIAQAFGSSVNALRRINYIERGSRIYVGQKLKIPSNAKNLKKNNKTPPKRYATTESSPQIHSGSSNSKQSHKVRAGDTLWDIARMYGTTTSKLRRLNGLGRSSRIYPGQLLQVSGTGGPDYVVHKVRRGETLSRIAKKYRTSISRILATNHLTDPDNIAVGSQLKIYVK